MDITEFNKLQIEENSKNIGIDFDGVIHKCSKGYHDGTVYDEPVEGAIEAIKEISKKYNIIVYTAKAKPDRPSVNGITGTEMVWDWLSKYGIKDCVKEVTSEKPRAIAYIDDKAIRFESWKQAKIDIGNIKYKA
jgi:hypothetical protein